MTATRNPWTPDQISLLRELLKRTEPEMTYQEIATVMGRTYGSIREAVRHHQLNDRPRVRRGCHQWSPEEFGRLERLLEKKLPYREIAQRMGLTHRQVRGAIERIGLSDPARKGARRLDLPGAMPIIINCIELERMTVPMIRDRLRQHGIEVSKDWIHDRVREQGQGLAKELRANAASRRARTLQRLAHRRQAAKRQQEAA